MVIYKYVYVILAEGLLSCPRKASLVAGRISTGGASQRDDRQSHGPLDGSDTCSSECQRGNTASDPHYIGSKSSIAITENPGSKNNKKCLYEA